MRLESNNRALRDEAAQHECLLGSEHNVGLVVIAGLAIPDDSSARFARVPLWRENIG
jgi:hypothetical protein